MGYRWLEWTSRCTLDTAAPQRTGLTGRGFSRALSRGQMADYSVSTKRGTLRTMKLWGVETSQQQDWVGSRSCHCCGPDCALEGEPGLAKYQRVPCLCCISHAVNRTMLCSTQDLLSQQGATGPTQNPENDRKEMLSTNRSATPSQTQDPKHQSKWNLS